MIQKEETTARIEAALASLEKALSISITIVDKHGSFHTESGRPLLGHLRQSHQKNKVCELGFCHKCVEHCRFEINEEGGRLRRPFMHTCWKGVSELVVPLVKDDMHYGSLFAGLWRGAGKPAPTDGWKAPRGFAGEFAKLGFPTQEDIEALARILTVFAHGMLSLLEEENSIGRTESDDRKSAVASLIYRRASERLRLEDVARAFHLSSSRTSHLVRTLFGRSFQELLLEERIKRAKTLLDSTDNTLGEIAAMSGFSDEYHFNRTFKSVCGSPPGRYRKEGRGRENG